jgi:glycosyltransferase involved in cell wall biosynthesis
MLILLFYVIRDKPSAIHIQWLKVPLFDAFILFALSYISSAKLIYTAHNILPHNSGEKFKFNYQKIYNLVDQIIVHASRTREELCLKFPSVKKENVSVIPHGVLFSNKKYSVIESEFYRYLFIGEISEYKGIIQLIKSWKNVNLDPRFSKKSILIIRGRCNELLSKQISALLVDVHNIDFCPGELSDDDFDNFVYNSEVIVLPYVVGSQSGVLSKAISYSKMVIVSKVGGLDEPLDIAKIGWSFSWGDQFSLNDKLSDSFVFLENNYYFEENNWSKIKDVYAWNRIGLLTSELY